MSSRNRHIVLARIIALSVLAATVAPLWADGGAGTPLTFGLPNTINKLYEHETATNLYFGTSTTPATYNSTGAVVTPETTVAWIFDPATSIYSPVGLTDPSVISSTGQPETMIRGVTADFVFGGSEIFSSTDANLGTAAWLFNRAMGSTVRVGLTGADYTASDGTQSSTVFLERDGLFFGTSTRYTGDITSQSVAWSYDPVRQTTTILTPTDPSHVDPTGSYTLNLYSFNATTLVFSGARYGGSTQTGNDVIVTGIHGEDPVAVGLLDSDHIRSDGYSSNQVVMTAGSFIAGYANRYNGAAATGEDPWIHNLPTNTTFILGLTDAAHTGSDGSRLNEVHAIDSSGDAAGLTSRYSGTTIILDNAWYQPYGQAAEQIGLTDAAHTSATGFQENVATGIVAPGLVIGSAYNYSSGHAIQDAWVYNDATHSTTQYGLSESGNTQIYAVYTNGFVMGDTHASGNSGDQFWVYNPISGKTSQVNPTNPDYVDFLGQQHLDGHVQSNANGFVAAGSFRYDGATQVATDAWLYSAASDTTYNFRYLGAPDGSTVTSLLDDGVVYGTYLHNGSQYAFSFSESGGFVDLSTLYQAQLSAIGANYLTGVTMESDGTLVGSAEVGGRGDTVLLVLQAAPVPEPISLAAFAGGMPLLLLRRRPVRR